MRLVVVAITDVVTHQAFEVSLIENDDMIEQIAATVTDPSLRDTILPRTSVACLLGLNAETLHRVDQFDIRLYAVIKDQIAGCQVIKTPRAITQLAQALVGCFVILQ
jgi:hypothetical protein